MNEETLKRKPNSVCMFVEESSDDCKPQYLEI